MSISPVLRKFAEKQRNEEVTGKEPAVKRGITGC